MRRLLVAPVVLAIIGCSGEKSPSAATANRTSTAVPPPAIRYEQHIAVEGMQPAGAELTNPFEGDAESADAGRKLFTSMNCDGCHGGGATGLIAPSLSDGRWRYGGSDGALYASINFGRPQGMPAFGGVLQDPIIWKLVTYIRSLPVPAAVPTQAW